VKVLGLLRARKISATDALRRVLTARFVEVWCSTLATAGSGSLQTDPAGLQELCIDDEALFPEVRGKVDIVPRLAYKGTHIRAWS
jgi:hypothetical protein